MEEKQKFYDEAFRLAELAREYDENAELEDAKRLYVEAGTTFLKGVRLEKSESIKDKIKAEVRILLERGEEISQILSRTANNVKDSNIKLNFINVPPPPEYSSSGEEDSEIEEEKIDPNELVRDAISKDEEGSFELAMELYSQAAEILISKLKASSSSTTKKDKIKKRKNIEIILDRIEELKRKITQTNDERSACPSSPTPDSNLPQVPAFDSDSFEKSPNLDQFDEKPVLDNEKLTQTELAVLRKTSVIGGKTFYPWMEVDRMEKFKYPGLFVDNDGLLPLSPQQRARLFRWERPSKLYGATATPKLIQSISPYSVKQTIITDCSFVSAISVAANYERVFKKKILTSRIFPQHSSGLPIYNPYGKYLVKLFINGVTRKITIDDLLPIDHNNQLLCSFSKVSGELWVSLLEKAFLKVMGGYNFPGSNGGVDLHYLIGWIPESVFLHFENDKKNSLSFDKDRLWERLVSAHNLGDCLVTCGTGSNLSEEFATEIGLVRSHAYAVLRIEYICGVKLLLLKNPWAHIVWKGKYSVFDNKNWTPQLQKALGYDREKASREDIGIFWIDWDSFIQHYHAIFLNWNPSLFKTKKVAHSCWPQHIGPKNDSVDMGENPQFTLKVPNKSTSVWILLSKHLTSVKELETREAITLHVYEKRNGNRVYYPNDPYIRGVYINNPHYLVRLDTEKVDSSFTLVVSQYTKQSDIYFTLSVYATNEIRFAEIPRPKFKSSIKDQSWHGNNCGGAFNAPTYWKNPQFKLSIRPTRSSSVIVQLKAPEKIAVHIMLFPSVARLNNFTCASIGDSGAYRQGFCYVEFESTNPGEYIIVVSTFKVYQEKIPFNITALSSTASVNLEAL